ncbi:MAG: hypothetical protein R2774_06845 [Saprospiraceae bacterium]
MKNYFLGILCLFIFQVNMAQENFRNFDFVICVDEEIVTALTRPVIISNLGNNISKNINLIYHPGNLSMSSKDYDIIFSDQDIQLAIQFDYYKYSPNGNQKIYNYNFEIDRNWFEKNYVIVKIYNMDKWKYRRI